MSTDNLPVHSAATIHAALTSLSVSVGRLEERMIATHQALHVHMTDEHKSFDEALDEVKEIRAEVEVLKQLYERGRGAWWLMAKLAAAASVIGAIIAWAIDHVSVR